MKCSIADDKYGLYCVPDSSKHRPVARRILAGETHENMTLTQVIWYMEVVDTLRGNIVHAGTYFGDWLPALSSVCPRGMSVLAFEPSSDNFECASMTIRLNNLKNIVLYNVALGEKNGEVELCISDQKGRHLGGGCRVVRREITGRQHETVKMMKLDDIIVEHPVSLIHLDVEKCERRVLNGAMDTILRNKPFLILETVPADYWMAENLYPLGYEKVAKMEGNTMFEVRE